jgi:outer membrane protein TolC
MKRLILILSCFAVFAESKKVKTIPDSHVRKIVVNLIEKNDKVKATQSYFSVNQQARNISMFKPISVKAEMKKDLYEDDSEFGSPYIKGTVTGGVNTLFNMQAAQAKYRGSLFSSSDASIRDVEEVASQFLVALAKYNLKLELLEITKEYIEARKIDLNEYSVRLKHGDLTKDEFLEAKLKISETESSLNQVVNDLRVHKNCVIAYMSMNEEEELKFDKLSIEELDDFIENSGVHKSNGQIKNEYAVKRYSAEKFAAALEFTPQVSLEYTKYLKSADDRRADEKDRASISLFIELSPYRFFHTIQIAKKQEHAKMSLEWENRKYKYEYSKLFSKWMSARMRKDNAKLSVKNKKSALDSAILRYKNGMSDDYDYRNQYKNMARAREDYHIAVERYYEAADRYIDETMEYLKITGILREIFLDEHKELA